ncbi:MAG TPA: TonB-dependent receptor plug domain-containing protein [Balneolaceae bacterium]|nr:TonB-dependent receptor plug domain-containing protein [Balneolaceae bacterium]
MRKLFILPPLYFLILIIGCSAPKNTQYTSGSIPDYDNESMMNKKDQVVVFDPDISLIDHLRKISGVRVNQQRGETVVMIRGSNTIIGNNSALFVVNGRPIGQSFRQLESTVSVSDIRRINVYKGMEATNRYGMRAGAGVVEITTK